MQALVQKLDTFLVALATLHPHIVKVWSYSKRMKNVMLSKALSLSLIIGTLAQGVGLMSPMHLLNAATPAKAFPDSRYIKTWNEVAKDWGKIKSGTDLDKASKKLKIGFNKAFQETDRKFWLSQMIQVQDMPLLKQDGDNFEFWSEGFKEKLFSFKVDGDKYIFENAAFVYSANESLEVNLQKLKAAVEAKKVSYFDWAFIPKAEASIWWAIGGALATFLVIRTFQTKGDNFRAAGDKFSEAGQELKNGNLGSSVVKGVDGVFKPILYNEKSEDKKH